jgi:GPH family glycoside/pentoside/hexuronide:cation symporter
VLAVLAGVGISVCYLIPNAMLPDVIELDELKTGERREGVFYGFFVFLQKIALALGTFLVGQALSFAGYISSVSGEAIPEQPDSALTAIRIAIGPLPAISLLLGIALTAIYPINKKRHEEILRELDMKKKVNRITGSDCQGGLKG